MSTTMLPIGSLMGSPAPMAAAIGCSIRWASDGAGPLGRLVDRPPLDRGDGRRHADDDPGPVEPADTHPLQQQPDHALGDLEVGDGALAQRAHGDDVARRAPDHLPGLVAHGQHVLGAAVERDDRRLVQHDALAARVHQGVGGAEVDGEVAGYGCGSPLVPALGSGAGAGLGGRRRRHARVRATARRMPAARGDVRRAGADGPATLAAALATGRRWPRPPSAFISRSKSSMLDMNVCGLRLTSQSSDRHHDDHGRWR